MVSEIKLNKIDMILLLSLVTKLSGVKVMCFIEIQGLKNIKLFKGLKNFVIFVI